MTESSNTEQICRWCGCPVDEEDEAEDDFEARHANTGICQTLLLRKLVDMLGSAPVPLGDGKWWFPSVRAGTIPK